MSEVVIEVAKRPIREVNAEIRESLATGHEVIVRNTRSRHNLGIGLPNNARIRFEGSVGYYCGGLNNGATIQIERNAGWGVARRWLPGRSPSTAMPACPQGPRCWADSSTSRATPDRAAGSP